MLSNFLRIRKHLGTGWLFFHLMMYTMAVPVFFLCSFFEGLFTLRNPFADWSRASRLAGNVATLWRFIPRIISNKPYFYKVL